MDASWYPNDNNVRRDVLYDHGSGADHGPRSNVYSLTDDRADSHMRALFDVDVAGEADAGRDMHVRSDAAIVFHDCS